MFDYNVYDDYEEEIIYNTKLDTQRTEVFKLNDELFNLITEYE